MVDGEINPSGIGRSRKKTMNKTIELMVNHFKESGENPLDYEFNVGFGFDVEEGKAFHEKVLKEVTDRGWADHVALTQIGATIAVHTGPYAIGIGIIKRYEKYL